MGNVRMRAEQINYGATNVKVALDDLDPATLIDLNNRMNRIDAWKDTVDTEEKTGAYVEYPNALALNAVAVSADITASQNLHGYDKPWVGGAGKNLFDEDYSETADIVYRSIYVGDGTFTMSTDAPLNTGGGANLFFFAGQVTSGASTNTNGVYQSTSRTVTAVDGYVTAAYRDANNVNPANYHTQIEVGTVATSYEPYSNICPITGFSTVTITDVDAESHTATVTVALGSTVYGGSLDLTSGELTITHANIASYNGETIGEPWISSMDEYTEGGTPTTGAQVVYTLATPTTTTLTAAQLALVKGYNRLSADTGDITVEAYTGAAWGGDEA